MKAKTKKANPDANIQVSLLDPHVKMFLRELSKDTGIGISTLVASMIREWNMILENMKELSFGVQEIGGKAVAHIPSDLPTNGTHLGVINYADMPEPVVNILEVLRAGSEMIEYHKKMRGTQK